MVLNLDTGLVSPQFHCYHDDHFETVRHDDPFWKHATNWQVATGFQGRTHTSHQQKPIHQQYNTSTVLPNITLQGSTVPATPETNPAPTANPNLSPPPTVEQQTQQISPINLETTRRSQCTPKPTDCYKEYQESLQQDNIALFTNFEEHKLCTYLKFQKAQKSLILSGP